MTKKALDKIAAGLNDAIAYAQGDQTRARVNETAATGILSSVQRTATGLHQAGLIDKATMSEFDALCLTPVERDTD